MRGPAWLRLALADLAAAAWIAIGFVALGVVAWPWRHLGGIVGERLRWLERFALFSALWLGFCAALWCRPEPDGLRGGWARPLRSLFYPPAILAAAGLLMLWLADETDPIGVLLTALVAYSAGAWAGLFEPLRAVARRLAGVRGRGTRGEGE